MADETEFPSPASFLRVLRVGRKYKQEQVAEGLGISKSQYVKMERGERAVDFRYIPMLAHFYKIPVSEVVEPTAKCPLIGTVRDDGLVYLDTEGSAPTNAPSPPFNAATVAAVRVEGNSMSNVASENWLVYFNTETRAVDESDIGKLCLAWVTDETLPRFRRLYRGFQWGRFDLVSPASNRELNQAVERVCDVSWIKPVYL